MRDFRNEILKSTVKVFGTCGVKFTLDDIARDLAISKKSIYKYFDGKEDIIRAVIDWVFEDIEQQHYKLLERTDLDPVTKLKHILIAMPTVLPMTDNQVSKLKELYPQMYQYVLDHFMSKWDLTLRVLDDCIAQNLLRPIPHAYFKTILVGIFDAAIASEDYLDTVEQCVEWVFRGLQP